MKFLDDFVSYCQEFTGCPEVFLRWAGLLALSAVAGEKHTIRRGDWDVHPNLWVLLVGNSSSYKSTGLASARRLLHQAQPGILAAQEYSHEALIEDIAANPHRVFFYDEAESFFKMLNQKYNAPMRSAMMSLYNGVPIQRNIKGKDGQGQVSIVDHAYISWGGASTPYQIASQMDGSTTDMLSGFLPRFLLVPYFGSEQSLEDPPPADREKAEHLIERLRFLSSMDAREYHYTPDALAIKSKWLKQFNKRAALCDPVVAAFYRKMRDEHFHKIAMLSAFERTETDITPHDVGQASLLLYPIEAGWETLLERFTEKEWDREAKKVETFLRTNKQVDRQDILRSVRGIRAQKLSAILQGFEQDNLIRIEKQTTEKRPKTVISWMAE